MARQLTPSQRILTIEAGLNKVYKDLTKLAELDPRQYQIADIMDLVQMSHRKVRRLLNGTPVTRDSVSPGISDLREVQ